MAIIYYKKRNSTIIADYIKIMCWNMKGVFKILTVLYVLFPFIVVPYIAIKANNWYYLLGIVFYFIAIMLVVAHQKIIFMIPLIFCFWFWFTYGFSVYSYVFFMFVMMCFGAAFYMLAMGVKSYIHRILPENKEAANYDLKMERMEERLKEYKLQNPGVAISPEIMDTIRNEVFFNTNN